MWQKNENEKMTNKFVFIFRSVTMISTAPRCEICHDTDHNTGHDTNSNALNPSTITDLISCKWSASPHVYHKSCLRKWKRINPRWNGNCFVCFQGLNNYQNYYTRYSLLLRPAFGFICCLWILLAVLTCYATNTLVLEKTQPSNDLNNILSPEISMEINALQEQRKILSAQVDELHVQLNVLYTQMNNLLRKEKDITPARKPESDAAKNFLFSVMLFVMVTFMIVAAVKDPISFFQGLPE
jgi:hypothetical protein